MFNYTVKLRFSLNDRIDAISCHGAKTAMVEIKNRSNYDTLINENNLGSHIEKWRMMGKTSLPTHILYRVKANLEKAYGSRLKGVVVYGSEARGEAQEDNDIDLLVLLDGDVDVWDDAKRIIHALYHIQLDVARPIHATPVNASVYESGEYGLYQNAQREGMLI
jgi:predicted nucleotidyltransferase